MIRSTGVALRPVGAQQSSATASASGKVGRIEREAKLLGRSRQPRQVAVAAAWAGRSRSARSRTGPGHARRSGRATLIVSASSGDDPAADPDHGRPLLPPSSTSRSASALVQRLLVLGLGVRVGHDPAADLVADAVPLDQHRPDRDVEAAVAAPAEVADRPGVEAPPGRFQLVDDLHGPDLRGPGDRAAGEDRADHVDRPGLRPQPPLDRRDQVMDLGEALDRQRLDDPDRAVPADPAQVVALQVDDHRQLGPVLGARAASSAASRRSSSAVCAARPRPLDRPGHQPVAPRLVEPLGAGADDGQVVPRGERPRTGRGSAP